VNEGVVLNPRIFREYDIRGHADRDLDDAFVAALGDAIAEQLREDGARRITLGRDGRLSSPRIHRVMRQRLVAGGLSVDDVGVVHSPGLYFSVFRRQADGGVMITASHNPGEDNGFKIMSGRATIHGEAIQRLRARIEAGRGPAVASGSAQDVTVLEDYVAYIAGNVLLGPRRPKVVVDGGNGAGGATMLAVLRRLGVPAEGLYCEPDGRFPHHHPDPTVPENLSDLIARVQASGAELGIALDGDADRIGVVDARGRIVWGDQLLLLFARDILAARPGATFVSEVKCSQSLYDDITARGGRAIMWKAGHSLIKAKMKEENAVLAGEMSGHLFFADRYFGFDDAIYAAARLIELVSHERTLADLVDTLPVLFNTPELRVPCPEELKFELVERAVAHYKRRLPVVEIDGARVQFPGGWGLVRASHTGPLVVLRCEADSAEQLAVIRADLEACLDEISATLSPPAA
jgi:phosphomannomutase/phosphoglucomutase